MNNPFPLNIWTHTLKSYKVVILNSSNMLWSAGGASKVSMASMLKLLRDTAIKHVLSRKTVGKVARTCVRAATCRQPRLCSRQDHLGNVYYTYKEGVGHPYRRAVKQSRSTPLEDFESHAIPVKELRAVLSVASAQPRLWFPP